MSYYEIVKHMRWAVLLLLLFGCEREYPSDNILDCTARLEPNFTLGQLHELAGETAIEIRDSLSVSAVIISNDKYGNMFNELYLQSKSSEGNFGIRIELELRDSYLRYPLGMEVHVDLNGLWVRKKHGVLSLGKPFMVFGTLSIGRIPYHEIDSYIIPTCEGLEVQPTPLGIQKLNTAALNTLVEIQGVEFIPDEIGYPLAEEFTESTRNLTDCEKREVRVITSGYAEFYEQEIPDAQGTIEAILMADRKGPYLRIRSMEDIRFDSPRCLIPVEPLSTNAIFISELADPDNAPEARFIELYNATDSEIPLEGWQLIRYTNANTEPGSTTDLSGYSIGPKNTFIAVADSIGFASLFDMRPDLIAGKNSAADSNGDDTLLLMDPFGSIIDIFGRIGEDGSGTDHEFEDGRVLRKLEINQGNPEFSPSEWMIYNDSGGAGTIKDPQQAPEDFTPGIRL